MDFRILFFAIYETLLAIIFGLITIYIVTRILENMFLRDAGGHALKEGNIAFGLVAGTIVLCSLILIQPSILPSIHALQVMLAGQETFEIPMFLISFCYFLVFYAITTILSILVLFLGIFIYFKVSRHVDEIAELKSNNIAVAAMLSIVILGLTLFIKPSVERFVSSLVSYDMIEETFSIDAVVPEGQVAPPPQRILPEHD
jgi:hypothetical protein